MSGIFKNIYEVRKEGDKNKLWKYFDSKQEKIFTIHM